ncbi:hypothetical protein [Burkholderia cepacia]|nr:hypothetical protein [Burkholderia cepacia]
MSKDTLRKKVGFLRAELQMGLNDLYIWTSFARQALVNAKQDQKFLNQERFRVPSKIRGKEVERSPDQLRAIATSAVEHEIYFSVFVYAVAQVEAFVGDILLELLRFDTRRVKTHVKGIDHTAKIDVAELVDASSREELIEKIIKKNLDLFFYAAPSLQMQYFQAVTGAKLTDDLVAQWIEIKATRDIIVHNSGVANSKYTEKAGSLARAGDGETLPMTDQYFSDTIAAMKSLVGKTASAIQADLKKAEKAVGE